MNKTDELIWIIVAEAIVCVTIMAAIGFIIGVSI